MKGLIVLCCCFLLSACAVSAPHGVPAQTIFPAAIITPLPTNTPEPTSTVSFTSTPETASIDPTRPFSEWPEETLAQYPALANPSNATGAERQAADDFLLAQWRLVLNSAGVPDASGLEDYDLLGAIIDYARSTGTFEVVLPVSLHELIILDNGNLTPYGAVKGLDPNKAESYYGYGENASPHPSRGDLLNAAVHIFDHGTIFGKKFDFARDPQNPPNMVQGYSITGDAQVLVNIPGMERSLAQALVTKMIKQDGFSLAYAETLIIYRNPDFFQTNSADLCEKTAVGQAVLASDCEPGKKLAPTEVTRIDRRGIQVPLTHEALLTLIKNNRPFHITVYTGTRLYTGLARRSPRDFLSVWANCMSVGGAIETLPIDLPEP